MRTRRAWFCGLANPRAFLATSFAVRYRLGFRVGIACQYGVDDGLLPFAYCLGEGLYLGTLSLSAHQM